jgi:flavin-dependent dehydrogenase
MSLPCIILGGGPAGAACAIELARKGRRVVVLERTRTAQHKVCGDFVSAEASTLAAYLGVDLWALGATEINSFSLASRTEVVGTRLPFAAAALSRLQLDEALLQAASDAGAEVRRGIAVTRMDAAGDRIVVHASGEQLESSAVVLATGKHDVRGCQRPKGSMIGFKLHLRSPGDTAMLRNLVHLTIFPRGYSGACLVENDAVSLSWVMQQELLSMVGAQWAEQVCYLSGQSGFFAPLLAGAQSLWDKPVAVSAIPYGFMRKRVIGHSIYPVGDQLAVIPSYTGDGISIALSSGIAAARAILNGISAGEFQRTIIARLRPQMRWANAASLCFSTSTGRLLGRMAAKALPGLMGKVIPLMINATRLRDFDPLKETPIPREYVASKKRSRIHQQSLHRSGFAPAGQPRTIALATLKSFLKLFRRK